MVVEGFGGLPFRTKLGTILVLAFAVRVVYAMVWSRNAALGFDASSYYELAKGIATRRRYEISTPASTTTALFPPGFPFFLAIGRALGFGTRTKMLLWTACLGTMTVALVGLLARRVATPKVGLIAAIIAAVYPNLWLADGAMMTETLTAVLVVGALMLVIELRANPRVVVGATLGFVLLWLALTRSDGLIVVVLCCAAVLSFRAGINAGIVAILIPVVGVGIWQARTQQEMHAFVPIAVNSWTVVAGANCEAAYYGDRVGTWELPCVKTKEAFTAHNLRGEIAQNRYARDQGIAYARGHLGRLPVVAVARLGRAFGAYDPWRELRIESTFEGRSIFWSRVGFVMYLMLVPLAMFGWRVARRGGGRNWFVLLIPVVAVTVSVAVGYGNHRFRMPLEPCLVVFAAMGLDAALLRRDRARGAVS